MPEHRRSPPHPTPQDQCKVSVLTCVHSSRASWILEGAATPTPSPHLVPKTAENALWGRPRVRLTELLVSPGGYLEDDPLDEEMQMAEEDEGGWRGGPALVLLDQAVALELPDLVRVLLDLLERVAGGRQGARWSHEVVTRGTSNGTRLTAGAWMTAVRS